MTRDARTIWPDGDEDDLAVMEILDTQPRESCPPAELVRAAGMSVLSPPLDARIAAHLARCAGCRELSVAFEDPSVGALTRDESHRILERVRMQTEAGRRTVRRRLWYWTAAAATIAAFGVLLFQAVREPAAGSLFALEKPEPPPAEPPRSAPAPLAPSETEDLAAALVPYRANDYEEAARALSAFVRKYPRSAAGHFYLGVSDLFLDRDVTGARSLALAEQLAREADPTLADRARWYLAITHVRTGQVGNARVPLQTLCDGGGAFARRACDGLQTLSTRLSGTVTDAAGQPLEGVTVGEYLMRAESDHVVQYRSPYSATTNASGQYGVSGWPHSGRSSTNLRASRPGYFTAGQSVSISQDMRASFNLVPWSLIAIDEVVASVVEPDSSPAGSPEAWRRFAVVVPASGAFEVSLKTPVREGMDLWLETPNGDVHSPRLTGPLHLSVPVAGGATCQITIVNNGKSVRPFELRMRIR